MAGPTPTINGHSTNGHSTKDVSASTTVAEFVSSTTYGDLSPEVVAKVKELLVDSIAVASNAGAKGDSTEPFIKAILTFSGPQHGNSTVFTKGHNFLPQYAALLNATFAHTYDFDDTHATAGLHPGASVVPAALAQSELSDVDGKTLLTALAVGYEVICRLALACAPGSYIRGFHNTGTCGIFGAIAAICKAKNLPSTLVENAFGLAGSKAAGSMQFMENGAWNKRLHPGFAAHDALLCVILAESGIPGASKVFEGKSGFLHSYAENGDPTKLVAGLGKEWVFMATALKPYPACRVTHTSIDLATKMSKVKDVPVESITCTLETTGYGLVGVPVPNKIQPENIVDAQFSNYIQTAIAWLHGNELGWSAYDRIFDSDAQALAKKVKIVVDDTIPICATKMTVKWQDGSTMEEYMNAPLGEVSNPFVFEKVVAKYLSLTRPVYGEKGAQKILSVINGLENHKTKDLMSLL